MYLCLVSAICAICACAIASENAPAVPDPAAERIATLHKAIQNNPASWQPHIDLAAELCRKARDSEEISYYNRAEAELRLAFKLSPDNYDAHKVEISILLGRHDLAGALRLASELNRKAGDDLGVWTLLAEINAALGNYTEAVRDAQWVLDLRPGSTLGFITAARLRAQHGDAEGSIEFYDEALRRIAFGDLEEKAWLLTQSGQVALDSGDVKAAASRITEALKDNPQSRLAAVVLARVRAREGNLYEAESMLRQRYEAIHDAHSLYLLAEILERAGQSEEAAAAFRSFETLAKASANDTWNDNLELISYYVDRDPNPGEALRLAIREGAARRDARTLAAWAWALYANGKYAEAHAQMERALEFGIRDAAIFCRAARISAKTNDLHEAEKYEREAEKLDPSACPPSRASEPVQAARTK